MGSPRHLAESSWLTAKPTPTNTTITTTPTRAAVTLTSTTTTTATIKKANNQNSRFLTQQGKELGILRNIQWCNLHSCLHCSALRYWRAMAATPAKTVVATSTKTSKQESSTCRQVQSTAWEDKNEVTPGNDKAKQNPAHNDLDHMFAVETRLARSWWPQGCSGKIMHRPSVSKHYLTQTISWDAVELVWTWHSSRNL